MSLGAADDACSCSVCSAVSPWSLISMSMPLSSKSPAGRRGARCASRRSTARRRGSVCAWSAIGLASRKPATPSDDEEPEVDGEDRQPAREARRRCSRATSGLRISAMTAGDDEDQQHGAGRARERVEREHAERQHDELDPARDDDRTRRRGGGSLSGGARSSSSSVTVRSSMGAVRESMRRARRAGDHPLRRRPRRRPRPAHAARRCCPGCARSTRRRSSSSTARTPPAASGITPKIADELFAAGVDVITLGNHAYHRREIYAYLDDHERILRPANFLRRPARPRHLRRRARRRAPRRRQPLGQRLPARRAPRVRRRSTRSSSRSTARPTTCSSTSTPRRRARRSRMGWYLDGRVTAVVGTHTHVPTADARVLPGGTAYITDVGMTGPRGGVIGVEQASRRSSRCAPTCRCASRPPRRTRGSWASSSAARRSRGGRRRLEQLLVPWQRLTGSA